MKNNQLPPGGYSTKVKTTLYKDDTQLCSTTFTVSSSPGISEKLLFDTEVQLIPNQRYAIAIEQSSAPYKGKGKQFIFLLVTKMIRYGKICV